MTARSGSVSLPVTAADKAIEPSAAAAGVGWTTIVTVAVLPAGRSPRLAEMVPACSVGLVPRLDEAEMNWTSGGNADVAITPVASEGPAFATVSV